MHASRAPCYIRANGLLIVRSPRSLRVCGGYNRQQRVFIYAERKNSD